ncbi:MAG: hypothetical protein EGP04_02560 [SAR202 cluster bacterium]|nr:MAG: hypothetical protein EGP04_02560 [SAR202 cluster bacterium]
MPKNNRKSKSRKTRRSSTPNVFVQNRNTDDDKRTQNNPATTLDTVPTRTSGRVERATRNASVRSEIYTRSQSAELKKLGILSLGIIVTLSVLTFVL